MALHCKKQMVIPPNSISLANSKGVMTIWPPKFTTVHCEPCCLGVGGSLAAAGPRTARTSPPAWPSYPPCRSALVTCWSTAGSSLTRPVDTVREVQSKKFYSYFYYYYFVLKCKEHIKELLTVMSKFLHIFLVQRKVIKILLSQSNNISQLMLGWAKNCQRKSLMRRQQAQ